MTSIAMPQYQSHKIINALQIATVSNIGFDTTTDENPIVRVTFKEEGFEPREFNLCGKPTPKDGWYYVIYENGYESFSPADVFESGNTRWNGNTFGDALRWLKEGKRVARTGWNGKGMFLFLVPGSQFTVNRPPLNVIYPEGTVIDYRSHIDMKTADGSIVPWVCSQTDALAEDWQIVTE